MGSISWLLLQWFQVLKVEVVFDLMNLNIHLVVIIEIIKHLPSLYTMLVQLELKGTFEHAMSRAPFPLRLWFS